MKVILFLDDWMLDGKEDIVRRFVPATFVRYYNSPFGDDGFVEWNPARKCYESVRFRPDGLDFMESPDGINWSKGVDYRLKFVGAVPDGCEVNTEIIRSRAGFDAKSVIYEDTYDPDPSRRYKILLFPYTRTIDVCGGIEGGPGVVACSADGVNWTMDTRHQWYSRPKGSDTPNNIYYNPRRKVWQVICRRYNNDRRVAMCESPDLLQWTEPRVIIHPDSLDSSLLQFYGMPTLVYEGEYFFGAVQCYYVPSEEKSTEHSQGPQNSWSKWHGNVDGQLVYSYDGELWNRSDRTVFVPRTEMGTVGASCVYPYQLIQEDDKIVIHAQGTDHSHGVRGPAKTLRYELCRERFAYLEPVGGWGRFITRCIAPFEKELTLNYHSTGQILVQVTDLERKPFPGYTFEECTPLKGNEINGKVSWKKKKDLSPFIGQRIRLEFRMIDARMYAIRLSCGPWYTNTPEPLERI
jgi:hypothetical protein